MCGVTLLLKGRGGGVWCHPPIEGTGWGVVVSPSYCRDGVGRVCGVALLLKGRGGGWAGCVVSPSY